MSGLLELPNLRRLLRAAPLLVGDALCSDCGQALPADHAHVANLISRTLQCICPRCHATLVAGRTGASDCRPVPRRFMRLPEAVITDAEWSAFEIPVGLAFFFHNSALDRVVAAYPSPAGATESLLSATAWERVLAAAHWTRTMAPDVEALLVRRTGDVHESFIAPIDACYELVGRIRRRWSGFGGGAEVRDEINSFFARLRERSEQVAS